MTTACLRRGRLYLLATAAAAILVASAAEAAPFAPYTISYVGSAEGDPTGGAQRVAVDYSAAERDAAVVQARAALKTALKALEAEAAPQPSLAAVVVAQRRRFQQALLNAQEALLPPWARWRSYRPPGGMNNNNNGGSGSSSYASSLSSSAGSYRDMKTSSEDDTSESFTWLNEFFHPAAFVDRNSGGAPSSSPSPSAPPPASINEAYARRPVAYWDYDPLTGAPYANGTVDMAGLRAVHGPNRTFLPMSSTFDARAERLFYREGGAAGCRFSVPFFSEPLLPFEEGAQLFVSANGNLLATSYSPCGAFFCNEYRDASWPGVYLIYDDLYPIDADRRALPIVVGRDPEWFVERVGNGSAAPTVAAAEGFSGIWIDRYVYANDAAGLGTARHGGDAAAAGSSQEDLADGGRQVSVVLTYENVPVYGAGAGSVNLTAQVELFTNGTVVMRYRGVPAPSGHFGDRRTHISPSLVYTALQRVGGSGYGSAPLLRPLPDSHPLFALDQFNSTDLSVHGLVAMRFDVAFFGGHRAGSGADVAPQRCRISTSGASAASPMAGTAVDMFTVPPGRRRRGPSSACAEQQSCGRCVAASEGVSGLQCVWCAGIRNISSLAPASSNNALLPATAAGVCMPLAYAGDYCPPSAQHTASSTCALSAHVSATTNATHRTVWDYYNVTTLSYAGATAADAQRVVDLLTTAQNTFPPPAGGPPSVVEARTRADSHRFEIMVAMAAAALQRGAANGEGSAGAQRGLNVSLAPVPAPSYVSPAVDTEADSALRGAQLLRRAPNNAVGSSLVRAGTYGGISTTSATPVACRSNVPQHYGPSTLTLPSGARIDITIPLFPSREAASETYAARGVVHSGLSDSDGFVGYAFASPVAATPLTAGGGSLRALPTRPAMPSLSPSLQACHTEFSTNTAVGVVFAAQLGVVSDDSPSSGYPPDRTTAIGQADYVYASSTAGAVDSFGGAFAVGCTGATIPTRGAVRRMALGTDDFSNWYVREARPPLSSVLRHPSLPSRPSFGYVEGGDGGAQRLWAEVPTIPRPGRVVTIIPNEYSCAASTCLNGGRCNRISGRCECDAKKGFEGPNCGSCGKGNFFRCCRRSLRAMCPMHLW